MLLSFVGGCRVMGKGFGGNALLRCCIPRGKQGCGVAGTWPMSRKDVYLGRR